MITFERMLELYSKQQDIFLLCPMVDFGLTIYVIKLNKDMYVGKKALYYHGRVVADYKWCYEKIDLKFFKMNGVCEDCLLMYSYDSIEEDLL